jgi:hypothetical protein
MKFGAKMSDLQTFKITNKINILHVFFEKENKVLDSR